jgi:hypothetical protein
MFRLTCFVLTLGHLQRLLSKNNLITAMAHSYTSFFVKMSIKSILHSQLPRCFHQSRGVLSLQQHAASGGIPMRCSVRCISTWCFQYDSQTKRLSMEWLLTKPSKAQKISISKVKKQSNVDHILQQSGNSSQKICSTRSDSE